MSIQNRISRPRVRRPRIADGQHQHQGRAMKNQASGSISERNGQGARRSVQSLFGEARQGIDVCLSSYDEQVEKWLSPMKTPRAFA